MYRINKELIVRDNDMTLFSLENMEIMEFNEVGFKCIKVIESEVINTFSEFVEKIKDVPDIILSDIKDFWDSLIEHGIIIEISQ